MRDQVWKLCRYRRAHDQNGIMNARLAKRDALIHRRNTEPMDGQLLQRACEFEGAMAISIRLDDSQYLGTWRKTTHVSEILREGIQIARDGGGGGLRRRVHAACGGRIGR